ncbi:MAG TPA: ABC transporter ATP-binding protein, partial [Clostridia bacterium]|nr:ABC transporter ATP-binding protein [Clostridia bacterium]
MRMENRDYRLADLIGIPFHASPGAAALLMIESILSALIPSLQILATASFIDTALGIFSGRAGREQIAMPLLWVLLPLFYRYTVATLMGLVRSKMNIKLTETYRTAIAEKRAKLEYSHVENNETWDLIERVGKDPAERLYNGFDCLLQMASIAIRAGSTLLVLTSQVRWAALAILAFSAPLFFLAVKSGRVHYQASQEAARYA